MGRFIRHYPKLEWESVESQHEAGRFNPAWTVTFDRYHIILPCGSTDLTAFWSMTDKTARTRFFYCLSRHLGLGYVGLTMYSLECGDALELDNAFWQGYEQTNEAFGEGWEDKSDGWLFNKCLEYLEQ